jgi:hypothetical protein
MEGALGQGDGHYTDVRTRERVESGKGLANCTGGEISRERWNPLEFRLAFWTQNLPCIPDFFPMRLCSLMLVDILAETRVVPTLSKGGTHFAAGSSLRSAGPLCVTTQDSLLLLGCYEARKEARHWTSYGSGERKRIETNHNLPFTTFSLKD